LSRKLQSAGGPSCPFFIYEASDSLRRRSARQQKDPANVKNFQYLTWHWLCLEREVMAYKVLVIEDNTDCRELFATLIRHLGFQVVEADDGELGVQKALSEIPDLIFMDIGLPSMSGIKATACLRASKVTKNIPIIICTGWTAEKHREAALQLGAQAVICKPISLDRLQALLLRHLPIPADQTNVQ
jgi:CheY-like chemotaxis protein